MSKLANLNRLKDKNSREQWIMELKIPSISEIVCTNYKAKEHTRDGNEVKAPSKIVTYTNPKEKKLKCKALLRWN